MFDRYMKQALTLSVEIFMDDGRLFLEHHLSLFLQQAPIRLSPPGTLSLPTISQWHARRLLKLLQQRGITATIELLNHLHIPANSNLINWLGLFFSFFPEYLEHVTPTLRSAIPLNFNWLSLCLTEGITHLSQQIHSAPPIEKTVMLDMFKQAEPALNTNERQCLIYVLLPLALEKSNSILIRALTCDLLYRLAKQVPQSLQETIIDCLLQLIHQDLNPLLYLSVLQTLGAMAITATPVKKESIVAVLLPFATSHEPKVRKTIVAALQGITHQQEHALSILASPMPMSVWIESVKALRVILLATTTPPTPETIARLVHILSQTPNLLYLPSLNSMRKQEDSQPPSCNFGKK